MLSFSRFAYVCFATGLLKEGLALLHWSTTLLLLAMCVIAALIYPFRCFLENDTDFNDNLNLVFQIHS